MKFVFYTNSVSPHQLPLAEAIIGQIGAENYRYVYTTPLTEERRRLGWGAEDRWWLIYEKDDASQVREWLSSCDVLLTGIRDFAMFEKRAKTGKTTLYYSERWFKPIGILPGWVRMLHPAYLKMVWRVRRLLRQNVPFYYLPIGVHAARDMLLIAGLERVQHESGWLPLDPVDAKGRMRMWGYFVAPSSHHASLNTQHSTLNAPLRILWLGRHLKLKRVDCIIKAVRHLRRRATLDLYGVGPEESRLIALAQCMENVMFHPPVPIDKVRELMRSHDVFVFPSNGYEGWGAVVSEALSEGMVVFGSSDCGAPATLLPLNRQFKSGDWRSLRDLLENETAPLPFVGWTPEDVAECMVNTFRG